VALILDVPVLVQRAIGTEASRNRKAAEANLPTTKETKGKTMFQN
jgi:hypothetical protein